MLNKPNGYHYLCELFDCDMSKLDDHDFLRKTFLDSVKNTSLVVLHDYFYKFSPQGVTGFLLLSTSHISVHTWPEHNYIAFDVFSCGNHKDTLLAVENIVSAIGGLSKSIQLVERGYKI
ncbi:adenosylmethionine decarboxylase [Tenacibaculum sp. KUL118]|nr:adenosylmethionine decarboxylase [Tenacibaculum sp. KUL118]